MTNNKLTKMDYFKMIATIVETSTTKDKTDIMEFINHEMELLSKKSEKSKETKTKKANEALANTILEVLATLDKPVTITDLMAEPQLETYPIEVNGKTVLNTMTNQKLSAIMAKLVKDGTVIREQVKKRAYFSFNWGGTNEATNE